MQYTEQETNSYDDIDTSQYRILPEVPKQSYYVDPKLMFEKFVEFQELRKAAIERGEEEPRITPYLADCIMRIANHLSYRWNFINYSYRDEFVLDGIVACVKGFNTFDPKISTQIFSYFTNTCFRAAVKRIQMEEDENNVKAKAIYESDVDSIVTQAQESGDFDAEFIEWMKTAQDFKMKPEKVKEKKEKEKPSNFVELEFE